LARRRQYVYKFRQWGIYKYRQNLHCPHEHHHRRASSETSHPSDTVITDSPTSSASWSTSGKESPETPQEANGDDLSLEGRGLALKRRVYDILFALYDVEGAFPGYLRLLREVVGDPAVILDPEQTTLAISCARSCHSQSSRADVEFIRCTLRWLIDRSCGRLSGHELVLRLAEVYMLDATNQPDTARRLIRDVIHDFNFRRDLPSLDRGVGVDLLAYQLLDHGLQLYDQEWSPTEGAIGRTGLLHQYLSQQLFGTDMVHAFIRECLWWCLRELDKQSCDLNDTCQIPPHVSPAHLKWANGLSILPWLWTRWQANIGETCWDKRVETAFGIPAAEVLVSVYWLIMDAAPHIPGSSGDTTQYVQTALEGIVALQNTDDDTLSRKFIAKLTLMNGLVEAAHGPDNPRDFRTQAFALVRPYVFAFVRGGITTPRHQPAATCHGGMAC
jgi:hypothetical protein